MRKGNLSFERFFYFLGQLLGHLILGGQNPQHSLGHRLNGDNPVHRVLPKRGLGEIAD